MKRSSGTPRLLFVLLPLGALALVAGVALARVWLPEWQPGIHDKSFYVQRYQELAERAGVRLASGPPRLALTVAEERETTAAKTLDGLGVRQAVALGGGVRIKIAHPGTPPGASTPRLFEAVLTPEGQLLALRMLDLVKIIQGARRGEAALPPAPSKERVEALARLFLAPGEQLNPGLKDETGYPLPGSQPPQRIKVNAPSSGAVEIQRELVKDKESDEPSSFWKMLPTILFLAVPRAAGSLAAIILFFRLMARRRIDYANGLFLGALNFVAVLAGAVSLSTWEEIFGQAFVACFLSLWIVAAWSVGESYLRSFQPAFANILDSLRTRRLGPRGGRALLFGTGLGAVLAGLRLGIFALAQAVPGAWIEKASLRVPPLGQATPFSDGALLAAAIALSLALARRYVPERWVPWLAGALASFVMPIILVQVNPVPAMLAANLLVGAFLLWVLWRFGLTATLVAATASFLLPAAVFSGLHAAWMPLQLAVTGGSTAALLLLGWVGLNRPEQIELEGRKAPAFIRRIEEERRQHYELNLLTRMQTGLQPEVPTVSGWEIAVRSLLATEAGGDLYDFLEDDEGGLWIAAGDVAGHGYSCAIAQAMTAASLASLVHSSQTPPGILSRIDKVLRRNAAHRHFTSLALMRLDPATGLGRLANAGHPFPLLVKDGEVTEVAIAGLPLGQGPPREYREVPVEIPPGGVLVFCSDGLFEGTDWQGVPYGYDRPRELLKTLRRRATATDMLDALFSDWRRHLGAQEHQDDTTVVVIKRL